MGTPILFLFLAAIAIAAALGMVLSPNAVHSALFLILNLGAVAVLYIVLNAPFIAMVQITVYAGAIMVLFLFVIMLLGAERLAGPIGGTRPKVEKALAAIMGLGLLALFGYVLLRQDGSAGQTLPPIDTSPETLGLLLFETYVLPFEITAVLLLAAMIGVVVFSAGQLKKRGTDA